MRAVAVRGLSKSFAMPSMARATARPWALSPVRTALLRPSGPMGQQAFLPSSFPLLRSAIMRPSPFSTSSRAMNAAQTTAKQAPRSDPPPPEEEEEPPPKNLKEKLRFLSKRYGWWAVLVYLLLSTLDLSAVFLVVHSLGADYIRKLEHSIRAMLGVDARDSKEEQVAAEQVGAVGELFGLQPGEVQRVAQDGKSGTASLKQKKVDHDAAVIQAHEAQKQQDKKGGYVSSTVWAELVLAYTIHKTLLLPVRVMATAAVLPSFVRLMVRWGLAKPAVQVREAQVAAAAAKQATKKAP